jgi:hypothetical protein
MSFPIGSVSVETAAIKRVLRVAQKMTACRWVSSAGVFNCREIAGTSEWSQHAYGNAADLFMRGDVSHHDEARRVVAAAFVYQATHRTLVNRFVKLPIAQVIDHDGRRVWEPATGWRTYFGTTGDHVHISGYKMQTGTPACAR